MTIYLLQIPQYYNLVLYTNIYRNTHMSSTSYNIVSSTVLISLFSTSTSNCCKTTKKQKLQNIKQKIFKYKNCQLIRSQLYLQRNIYHYKKKLIIKLIFFNTKGETWGEIQNLNLQAFYNTNRIYPCQYHPLIKQNQEKFIINIFEYSPYKCTPLATLAYILRTFQQNRQIRLQYLHFKFACNSIKVKCFEFQSRQFLISTPISFCRYKSEKNSY
eukprot:TRINITY_DN4572_c0_g1_i9.p3 TRINITY_DN4572_c0_g1~~TRINITY_DN4572_c0_g1_i9.p3  ORF type:complete len:215 (+),score=-29.46 TRINITY_DN4572_c0_g1_i9:1173-1817(+)